MRARVVLRCVSRLFHTPTAADGVCAELAALSQAGWHDPYLGVFAAIAKRKSFCCGRLLCVTGVES